MAFIWTREEGDRWAAVPLTDRPLELRSHAPSLTIAENDGCVNVLLTRIGISRHHVLVWGAGDTVRINGLPLPTGIHVLADHDEIQVGGRGPLYFSQETFPVVETFKGGRQPIECGRCTLTVDVGTAIVQCPNCFVVYHEDSGTFKCWTNSPRCRHCGHPTAFDAGFQWTPQHARA